MGWTFTEFDEQPADELFHYLSLDKLVNEHQKQQAEWQQKQRSE